jgi:hypothetical protein
MVRAVELARQVPWPVKLMWSREQDTQHDMYRPAYADRLWAALDAQGKPIGWEHKIAGSSIMARLMGPPSRAWTRMRSRVRPIPYGARAAAHLPAGRKRGAHQLVARRGRAAIGLRGGKLYRRAGPCRTPIRWPIASR